MQTQGLVPTINPNPLAFEELATSLASLYSYIQRGRDDLGMADPVEEFGRLYRSALKQPPSYAEITQITGQGLSAGDERSGRAAWLLGNIEKLAIYGVHSRVWHRVGTKYSMPLIDQLARVLDAQPKLNRDDLQGLGRESSMLDLLGVKDGQIWIVQTMWIKSLLESAIARTSSTSGRLFRGNVFDRPRMDERQASALFDAQYVLKKAFPEVPIVTMCVALHPETPDFELYQVSLPRTRPEFLVLEQSMVRKNSIDFADALREDHDALMTLSDRLTDRLFRGMPPCRGGRTLGILASAATRQLESTNLLTWQERDVIELLRADFNYDVPRDKVRHDLVDRLVLQGFMRKWGNVYFLNVKGIARYLYCLAKFTTLGSQDPITVLENCNAQRDRVVARFGCL
jgi:hypothetical protein